MGSSHDLVRGRIGDRGHGIAVFVEFGERRVEKIGVGVGVVVVVVVACYTRVSLSSRGHEKLYWACWSSRGSLWSIGVTAKMIRL